MPDGGHVVAGPGWLKTQLEFACDVADVLAARMNSALKSFLQRWVINTLAVLVATYVMREQIRYGTATDLFVATLILGILNSFLRPLLMLLSLPLLVVTLGLFTLVINALLLLLVSWLMTEKHFHVDSFAAAFWGALVISLVSLVLNSLTGSGDSRIKVQRGKAPPSRNDGGPVIDV